MLKTDILVINPGSTSSKIGVYREGAFIFEESVSHDPDVILSFGSIVGQLEYRKAFIKEVLEKNSYDLNRLKAIVGRGGILPGLKCGGYLVEKNLVEALSRPDIPQHASNLGGLIANEIAEELGIPSYIYDATTGADLSDIAKVSGLDGIERVGIYHVLNARAQSRNYAESIGRKYKDMKLIVCHMGGGITVTAHEGGTVIDGSAYDEGAMSPERTGGVQLIYWTKLCFSGKYTEDEVQKLIAGRGGLYSYLGKTDLRIIERDIEDGDEKAKLLLSAMAYQTAKEIAAMSVPLKGKPDAIILTGGMAKSEKLCKLIREYAGHIGEIVIMPGEDELGALAKGAERILSGEEYAMIFSK